MPLPRLGAALLGVLLASAPRRAPQASATMTDRGHSGEAGDLRHRQAHLTPMDFSGALRAPREGKPPKKKRPQKKRKPHKKQQKKPQKKRPKKKRPKKKRPKKKRPKKKKDDTTAVTIQRPPRLAKTPRPMTMRPTPFPTAKPTPRTTPEPTPQPVRREIGTEPTPKPIPRPTPRPIKRGSSTPSKPGGRGNKGKDGRTRHKLIGYWHNFVNGAGCPLRLSEMSDAWDVVDIAFADNDPYADGSVHFHLFSGGDGCPALDPRDFKRDMAALQARGKVFVLSLGGAEGTITLNNDKDEANFVASLTDVVLDWGFDGIDVDLESGSGIVVGSEIQERLGPALLRIEENLGRDLYLTMAPEHPYVHGGMIAVDGPWGAYLRVIDDTRSTLDLLHVQLYNNGGLWNPYGPVGLEGSVDMMVAHAMMLVEGFDLANGARFAPLRDDQVAIGLPSGPRSASSGQAPTKNILDALDCLTRGSNCGAVKPSFDYVNFGGVMTWSINWDQHDDYVFSGPVGKKLEEMSSQRS